MNTVVFFAEMHYYIKTKFPSKLFEMGKIVDNFAVKMEKCGAFSFAGGEGWSQVAKSRS